MCLAHLGTGTRMKFGHRDQSRKKKKILEAEKHTFMRGEGGFDGVERFGGVLRVCICVSQVIFPLGSWFLSSTSDPSVEMISPR